ncbi:MAG TPA: helicase-associated domain-containing protein, partial [Planctomycetota bacterium]|nr:helicase-associated domain-containing protein [Planctomycetota bacterium]
AWSSLELGRAVRLEEFLEHRVAHVNPLLDPSFEDREAARYPWHQPSEEELEARWQAHLERVLVEFLLPLGGARIGRDAAQALTVELTSVGRYLLGLDDDFEVAAPPPTERPARVQPDFEVVFLAPSPAHEAAIGRFGERIGSGVGALFRLTRAAAQTAAMVGLSADEALRALADASATPVPANVMRELRDWFAACRRIEIQPVELIRCPDAQTAARVLAVAGKGKLELLGESTLAIADRSQRSAVVRACRKAGLFLIEDSEPPAEVRKRPRSRRRRRGWS